MRVRTVLTLMASLVPVIAAIVLAATPAAAGTMVEVKQYTPDNYFVTGFAWFVDDSAGQDGCTRGQERVEVYDRAGGFATEAQVFARLNGSHDWQRVRLARAWDTDGSLNGDDLTVKCISIPEGFEVKLSTWKYNPAGPDRWDRKSGYATA